MNTLIECKNCGKSFFPYKYKQYIHYMYRINENYRGFKKEKESPKLSIVTRAHQTQEGLEVMNEKKIRVFLSYCHKDEMYKEQLNVHLSPLKKMNKIQTWDDRELQPGIQFDDIIKKHLGEDELIILLISADFLNSDYCYDIEMSRAMERCRRGECRIIPVIIRPCLWTVTPLKPFLALPKDGKAVSTYDNKDEAYLEIVTAIDEAIKQC